MDDAIKLLKNIFFGLQWKKLRTSLNVTLTIFLCRILHTEYLYEWFQCNIVY